MRVSTIGLFHGPAGARDFGLLRIETDTGITGWSEFSVAFAGPGLAASLETLARMVIGRDPRRYAAVLCELRVAVRHAGGGALAAVGAIENALLDVVARAAEVPVYDLLGGPVRGRVSAYWSHVCTYRSLWPAEMGLDPIRTREDIVAAGAEVAAQGFGALKTNIVVLDHSGAPAKSYGPAFARSGAGFPEMDAPPSIVTALEQQLTALREGAGDGVSVMLDINHNFHAGAARTIARVCGEQEVAWLELDTWNVAALADVRDASPVPVVSGEWMFSRELVLPLLAARAVDSLMIDPTCCGLLEASRIASLAEAYDITATVHNYYGHLATGIAAQLAAISPNVTSVEVDREYPVGTDSYYIGVPTVDRGQLSVPVGLGWGVDVNVPAIVQDVVVQ